MVLLAVDEMCDQVSTDFFLRFLVKQINDNFPIQYINLIRSLQCAPVANLPTPFVRLTAM
jgi:hypothetical protein